MKFLAAVDLSETSMLALDTLKAIAGDKPGDVTLLHVVDLDLYTAGGSVPAILEFARERLLEESARLAGCGLRVPSIRVEQGDAAQTILRVSSEESADLIVMTNLGKGARTGRLFGSTAERVASAARVPVLIERVNVPAEEEVACCRLIGGSPLERILVAVDVDDDPAESLQTVFSMPGVSTVHLVHVVEDAAEAEAANPRLGELATTAPDDVAATFEAMTGDPAESIVAAAKAWGATAVALQPCRHSALHRAMWGSVARSVALHAPCSILFVPARASARRA